MFWLSGVLTWCKWETEFEVRKSTLHWTVPSMPFFMQVLLKKRTEETNKVLFYGKAINSLNTDPVTYYTKTLGMKVKCTNSETELCTLLCQLLESLEQRQCHGRAHSTLLGPSYKFFNIHFINAFDFYKSTILDYFHIVIKNFFLVPFEWKGDYWTFSNECYLCNNNLFWNETFLFSINWQCYMRRCSSFFLAFKIVLVAFPVHRICTKPALDLLELIVETQYIHVIIAYLWMRCLPQTL